MHRINRSFRRSLRAALLGVAAPAALLVAGATSSDAATLRPAGIVLDGLANPRGIAVGPDGGVYVAEAGSGGPGTTIVSGNGETVGYGRTGGVSRSLGGVQSKVIGTLPSLAAAGGFGATGLHDLTFDEAGRLYGVFGFGADPAFRSALAGEPGSGLLGKAVEITPAAAIPFADLAGFEQSDDPDGEPNSNPFSIVRTGSGFAATDAGGNSVLTVDGAGNVSVAAVLPPAPNPLPFGPPVYQAVPTGAALGPEGDILVGQLTGFPFPVGAASLYAVDALLGGASTVAGGFTNLIDVASAGGRILALELDSDSLIGPGTTGSLFEVLADGTKSLLFGGLDTPTGLALGRNGRVYVAVNGLSPDGGRVIELAPVPLPAALPLLGGAVLLLTGLGRRRRRSA